MLADEFELEATQLQDYSESNTENTGSEYSQPQVKKRGRPPKTKDEMDIVNFMMKQDETETKIKRERQKKEKNEDEFDYKGTWLAFLHELGSLTYREWAHLKDRNLMCVWLYKEKAKQKPLVFMYKKKQ